VLTVIKKIYWRGKRVQVNGTVEDTVDYGRISSFVEGAPHHARKGIKIRHLTKASSSHLEHYY
jgi:hypothetical protein